MFSVVVNRITEYIKVKGQQVKLEIISHLARFLSRLLVIGFLGVLGLFLIFFMSFGLSALLNQFFESAYLGYLIVAGIYLLVILLISLFNKKGVIQRWIEVFILNANDQMEEDE